MGLSKHFRSKQRLVFVPLSALVTFWPTDALAYIDPGSGSLLLQIVMSAFFGAVFLGRRLIARAAATARRWLGGRAEPPTPPTPPTPNKPVA